MVISVIIPVYNDQEGLDRCLEALGSQIVSSSDFEVIVVDNNSNPAMVIAENHPFGTEIILCEKPGSYAARNAGMETANGDLLAFLDADCIPDKNWLKNGIKAIQSVSNHTLAGGEVLLTQSTNPTAVELYQRITGFGQKHNIQHKSFAATANLFIKPEDAIAVGKFNEELLSGGDLEWCWRAKEKGIDLIYVPDALVTTSPRKSLKAAIKQARRVAGGRYWYRNNHSGSTENKRTFTAPRRGNLESIRWILDYPELRFPERLRVLFVAITIKLAQILETVRLKLGGNPERL